MRTWSIMTLKPRRIKQRNGTKKVRERSEIYKGKEKGRGERLESAGEDQELLHKVSNVPSMISTKTGPV